MHSTGEKDYCATDKLVVDGSNTFEYIACSKTYRGDVLSAVSEFNGQASRTTTSPLQTESTPSPVSTPSSAAGPATSTPAAAGITLPKKSSNTGAIVGGIVGGLALCLIAGLAFFFIKRRSTKQKFDKVPPAEIKEDNLTYSDVKYAHAASELPAMQYQENSPQPDSKDAYHQGVGGASSLPAGGAPTNFIAELPAEEMTKVTAELPVEPNNERK